MGPLGPAVKLAAFSPTGAPALVVILGAASFSF